jgi:hypothetical protein
VDRGTETRILLCLTPAEGSNKTGGEESLHFAAFFFVFFRLFLAHTAAQFAPEHCVLFLDGAGWHKAHEPSVPSNMRLLPLPPYSPEPSPAQHLWGYVRENHMRNRIFDDLDEVMDSVSTSLHRLHQQPETLRSMIAFPWLLEAAA